MLRQLVIRLCRLASIGLLGCTTSVRGQRDLQEIPDPDPEMEQSQLEVAEGFEINLYAADPLLAKPIQMNFDPAGRLWIASSEVYPQIQPGQQANDKVLVIDDTNHDGVADQTTVFADGLLIPTGVLPGDGGVYVANSTELLHLSDSDGDGRADRERVVLSGFGTEDTHHILHTLRWGPDGRLYMNQSIYIHSHIETPYGVRRMNGAGVWAFRPEAMQLDLFTLGLVNPWGLAWNEYGATFETDGAGGEGINYVFPGFVGMTSPGAQRIVSGLNPGKPKLCGLEYIGGSHLPEEWRGDLITNDFRAHRVCRYKIREAGSGFAAQELDELVKTRHAAFRPIDVKLGPDGALYIADWYNPIIQHGEVDFRDPRRDHTHGRIWRITATNRDLLPVLNLYAKSNAELLAFLRSEEPFWRQQAKQVLRERGRLQAGNSRGLLAREELLQDLATWLGEVRPQLQANQERDLLEALWVYQALDQVQPELLRALLAGSDPNVRAAATRVLSHWQDRVDESLELLSARVIDNHPRVRLEAVRALARSRDPRACQIALRALDLPSDRFLEYCLWLTARDLQKQWFPAFNQGQIDFDGQASHLLFALQAIETPEVAPLLLSIAGSWPANSASRTNLLETVAALGNEQQLAAVYDAALNSELAPATRARLLEALRRAAVERNAKPSGELTRVMPALATTSPEPVRLAAIRLAASWRLPTAFPELVKLSRDRQAGAAFREAAIESLPDYEAEAAGVLSQLAREEPNKQLRSAAVRTLVAVDLEQAVSAATQLLSEMSAGDDPTGVVEAFLARRQADVAWASHLSQTSLRVPADIARLALRAAQTSGRDVNELTAAFAKVGGLQEPTSLSAIDRAALLRDVRAQGDPTRGESIFRRSSLNCQKCHAIGGAGGAVGPDLASIGASAQPDYLLESLLEPNVKIKENYHSLVIVTEDGKIVTGIKLRQTEDAVILRDAEDREIQVRLDAILEQQDGGSLMPSGLLEGLTRTEVVDLVRFLSELGKVGPYALSSAPYVRRWETLIADDTNLAALKRTNVRGLAAEPNLNWQPITAQVNGELPVSELAALQPPVGTTRFAFARFTIDAAPAGIFQLRWNSTRGLRGWLNDRPLNLSEAMQVKLAAGTHTLTVAVDPVARAEETGIRVEVSSR